MAPFNVPYVEQVTREPMPFSQHRWTKPKACVNQDLDDPTVSAKPAWGAGAARSEILDYDGPEWSATPVEVPPSRGRVDHVVGGHGGGGGHGGEGGNLGGGDVQSSGSVGGASGCGYGGSGSSDRHGRDGSADASSLAGDAHCGGGDVDRGGVAYGDKEAAAASNIQRAWRRLHGDKRPPKVNRFSMSNLASKGRPGHPRTPRTPRTWSQTEHRKELLAKQRLKFLSPKVAREHHSTQNIR